MCTCGCSGVKVIHFSIQETRKVSHFQYTAWPDHGIPDVSDGILGMMELARQEQGYQADPVVVHCRSVSHTHTLLSLSPTRVIPRL